MVPVYVPPAHVIDEVERIRKEKEQERPRPTLPLPIVVR